MNTLTTDITTTTQFSLMCPIHPGAFKDRMHSEFNVQCFVFFFVVSGKNNNSVNCLYSEHDKMTESGADKTMVNTVTMVKVNVRFMSRISHC